MSDFGLNHPLAVQRWSTALAVQAEKLQYFAKFIGEDDSSMIKAKKDLTKQAGEKITYGLRMKVQGNGVEGDTVIEGTNAEKFLDFYADSVFIDQRRMTVKSKGQMSEQRVPYNMRTEAKNALATWFAEDYDEQTMMYLAGARGVDTSFNTPVGWTGRANNPLTPPNADNIVFAGAATGKTKTINGIANQYYSDDMTNTAIINISLLERLVAKSETTDPMIQPFNIDGEKKFVLLMHTFQAYSLRNSTSTNDWVDIQKRMGTKSALFRNAMGEYADVILHKHRNVIRFAPASGEWSVPAARALFLGAQAGVIAWGGASSNGRYFWNEEKDDRGNALAVTVSSIYAVKKTRFNNKDFGVIAVDAYCKDPNVVDPPPPPGP